MTQKFVQLSLFESEPPKKASPPAYKPASRFLPTHFLTGLDPTALSSHSMLLARSVLSQQLKSLQQTASRRRFMAALDAEMRLKKTGANSVVILRGLLQPTP